MAFWVIHNKTVPLDVLRSLVNHPDINIREALARKRKLDEELFDILSKDDDPYVRQAIATNQKTPLGLTQKSLIWEKDKSE